MSPGSQHCCSTDEKEQRSSCRPQRQVKSLSSEPFLKSGPDAGVRTKVASSMHTPALVRPQAICTIVSLSFIWVLDGEQVVTILKNEVTDRNCGGGSVGKHLPWEHTDLSLVTRPHLKKKKPKKTPGFVVLPVFPALGRPETGLSLGLSHGYRPCL